MFLRNQLVGVLTVFKTAYSVFSMITFLISFFMSQSTIFRLCPGLMWLAQGHNAVTSDFIWDFGKLPFPTYLGKYFIRIGKIRAKIHEIGKIKAIFGLGMTPIYGLKNGQIKSLVTQVRLKPPTIRSQVKHSTTEH